MTAYVHLGTGKTGTTTLQYFVASNKELLKQKGILYSCVNLDTNRHIYLSHIVHLYTNDKKEDNFLKDSIKNLKEELKQNSTTDFLFSSEDVLWWHKDVDKVALALKDFFTEVGFDDIRIILYIRSQEDLLLSLCSQETKNADPTYNAKESKPENSSRFQMYEYKALAKAFMNTFGKENLILRLFDKNEFYKGDLIKDFLHIFNLDLDESFTLPPNQNEGLDLLGFELLDAINKHFDTYSWSPNGRSAYIPFDIQGSFFNSKDPALKFMPKKEIYKAYIEYFEESNEWVRKEFFPHKDRLFPKKDLSNYKENYELKEMKPEYWDKIPNFIVDFSKDRKRLLDSKDKELLSLKENNHNLNNELSNKNEDISRLKSLNSELINSLNQALSKLDENSKHLSFLKNFGTAKQRIHSHLAYKLGQAMIENSKSILGYIKMPFILALIGLSHKQSKYKKAVFPPLEHYPDYEAALKEKECLTYKLGEALIEVNKRGGGVAYIAFFKKARKLKKDFLANKAK